jgi:hypothetical protein
MLRIHAQVMGEVEGDKNSKGGKFLLIKWVTQHPKLTFEHAMEVQ